MSEQNKALVRRVYEEVWHRGNLALADELYSTNFVGHGPIVSHVSIDPELKGPERVKQLDTAYRTAFPDVHFTIEDQIAEGDKVVTRWTANGTHKGNLGDIPPTGKHVTVTGITISRIVGGKFVESWTNRYDLGLMQQLGAVAEPERVTR